MKSASKIARRLKVSGNTVARAWSSDRPPKYQRAARGSAVTHGIGVLQRVERVVQWDAPTARSFTNFAYDIVLLDLSREDELLDWSWINTRADIGGPAAVQSAPEAWRRWVVDGDRILPKIQRRVAAFSSRRKDTQLPPRGSVEYKILTQVYERFEKRKHAFESLASMIVGRIGQRQPNPGGAETHRHDRRLKTGGAKRRQQPALEFSDITTRASTRPH
jgi:hypothetical protein